MRDGHERGRGRLRVGRVDFSIARLGEYPSRHGPPTTQRIPRQSPQVYCFVYIVTHGSSVLLHFWRLAGHSGQCPPAAPQIEFRQCRILLAAYIWRLRKGLRMPHDLFPANTPHRVARATCISFHNGLFAGTDDRRLGRGGAGAGHREKCFVANRDLTFPHDAKLEEQ